MNKNRKSKFLSLLCVGILGIFLGSCTSTEQTTSSFISSSTVSSSTKTNSSSSVSEEKQHLEKLNTYIQEALHEGKQVNTMHEVIEVLNTNGFLIYSTWSFNIKEDEEIIKNFLDKTKLNYNLYDINIENTFQSNTKVGYHLIPPFYKGEGHYVCYLKNDENKIDANRTLLKKVKTKIDDHEFECYKYKDNYYLQNKFYIELSKLNITMLGIQINPSFKDSKTKLNHFITHVDNLKTYDEIYLTEQEAFSYLKGAQIKLNNNIKTNTKIVVVKYNNTSLGFAKKNDTILQNYYPKQLRIKE